MKYKLIFLLIIVVNFCSIAFSYTKPNIVVTIMPLASLVSMLTKDKVNVIVLDKKKGCPHQHHAKLSDKILVKNAKMVIYIDEKFDNFVCPLIFDYDGPKIKVSQFNSIDFKDSKGRTNWHFWLDLKNVKALQKELAKIISKIIPEIKQDIQSNLKEALVKIEKLDVFKRHQIAKMGSILVLSDSLDHFFKDKEDNLQLNSFQTSNVSLKNIKKIEDILSSSSIKYLVLDSEQNIEYYKKYKKIIIQLESENWVLDKYSNLIDRIFVDKYLKMINQLVLLKKET